MREFSGWRTAIVVIAAVTAAYIILARIFDSPTEVVQEVWTCLGIAGAIVTSLNLVDSSLDLKALRGSGRNGDLLLLARQGIRQDALRLLQMVAIVTTGLTSLGAQPILSEAQRKQLDIPMWTATSVIITLGIATIALVAVAQAILDRRVRERLYSRHGLR